MKRIFTKPLPELLTELEVPEKTQPKVNELISRITHPSFTSKIKERDKLREIAKTEQERYKEEEKRNLEARREYHKQFDKMKAIDKKLGDAKNIHATLAEQIFEEPTEHDLPIPENAFIVGTYPSGSAEWLKQRQPTVGGSDVGSIMHMDPEYGMSNYVDARASKLDPDPQEQVHEGACARGDQWEPALMAIVSHVFKEKGIPGEVHINKSTMSNDVQHANLDGFLVGDDGTVNVILEAKTSSFPKHWAEDEIPPGYVFQTQHYMDFYGINKAYLIVNIDDSIISIYEITPEDKVEPTIWAAKSVLKAMFPDLSVKEVKEIIEDGARPDLSSKVKTINYKDYVKHIVADYVQKWKKEREEEFKLKRARTRFENSWFLPWMRAMRDGIVWLDLETSGLSPKSGYIIEVGAARDDDGEIFDELYYTSNDHTLWNGTGMIDVHHISVEDITGKPTLINSDEEIKKLKDFVGNRVVVAHNAMFEKRWLSEMMDFDYADTMHMFSVFANNVPNNKMASLVPWSGNKYVNAHRAYADAEMMRDAFYDSGLHETLTWIVDSLGGADNAIKLYNDTKKMPKGVKNGRRIVQEVITKALKHHENVMASRGLTGIVLLEDTIPEVEPNPLLKDKASIEM